MIRGALGELDYRRYHLPDNPLFVREAAIDLINRNHRDPAFTPDTIARSLHISRRQLYRHFENADESVSDVIASQRLQTACSFLTNRPDLTLAQVAAMSGFPSAATFRNRFRARYGVGPREYRSGSEAGRPRVPTDDEARYVPSPDGSSSKS
ncbi:MAG: helix-turn-helix domain-containing protein [Actinomycetota bacterium]|nr:helix-turn-helix domain-containing protein [Actinomycetota bacterium]